MNKTTKGALAAGSAAVLLLGGATTLAFWTDEATVNGGSANSGYLTLDPQVNAPNTGACDTDWVYADGSNAGSPVLAFVPGDSITKDCTFVVGAEGDNLEATPTVPDTVAIDVTPAAASFEADVDATYDLAGSPLVGTDTITEGDDGDTLTASIVVTFPYGTDEDAATVINGNDTQSITAALQDLTVALTQDLGTGNPNA